MIFINKILKFDRYLQATNTEKVYYLNSERMFSLNLNFISINNTDI